jgi:hypothetical protein
LETAFILLEFPSPSRRIFIDSHSLPPLWFAVSVLQGCELLCFVDAYSRYHQIKMKESDQLVTSFTTPFGMFCYVTMSFGL